MAKTIELSGGVPFLQQHFPSNILGSISIVLLLTGCNPKSLDSPKRYFDLAQFAKAEAQRLEKQHLLVTIKVSEGNKSESQTRTNINWEEQLKFLADADINRPAWVDKYTVDTMVLDKNQILTYLATEANLTVRKIVLTFSPETKECVGITLEKSTENFLYSSWQKVYYTPGSQLNIYGHLSVPWLVDKDYATDLVVVQPEGL